MNMRKPVCLLVSLMPLIGVSSIAAADAEPRVILLWPKGAPGSEGKTAAETTRTTPDGEHVIGSVHRPSLTLYLPAADAATGAAVIIAPGGGHNSLWADHEGHNVARWLAAHGVAGLILKYRLAREPGSTYTIEGASLSDIQRAIRVARANAPEWGLKANRIGVMGFSAGGEIAALAAARYHATADGGAETSTSSAISRRSRP